MIDHFYGKLKKKSAGRILDVATGCGHFIQVLIDGFEAYSDAIGIDLIDTGFEEGRDKFKGKPVRFMLQDAAALGFGDRTFDTVSIAHSLHHLSDPAPVLAEMMRVLKPGGRLIVAEMFCDRQSPKQLSHVMAHHLIARIDRLKGICHRATLEKDEIMALISDLPLAAVDSHDFLFEPDVYDEKDLSDQWLARLEKDVEDLRDHPGIGSIKSEAEEIKSYFARVGFAPATQLVIIGVKG